MTIDPSAVPELIYDASLSWQKIYLRGYHIGGELELPIVGAFIMGDDWPPALREEVDKLPKSTPLAAIRYSLNFHLDNIGKSESV